MMCLCLWIPSSCTGIVFGPFAAFLSNSSQRACECLGAATGYLLGFCECTVTNMFCVAVCNDKFAGGIQPVATAQITASTGSVCGRLLNPIAVATVGAILCHFFPRDYWTGFD
ncbi:hypothetical protein BC830DRAFT_1141117 [Chytriomyces sp. MP71]|nr:hypothetical protein BC830DRAFT_1141117 [Chytriomyces sp. MP71]